MDYDVRRDATAMPVDGGVVPVPPLPFPVRSPLFLSFLFRTRARSSLGARTTNWMMGQMRIMDASSRRQVFHFPTSRLRSDSAPSRYNTGYFLLEKLEPI